MDGNTLLARKRQVGAANNTADKAVAVLQLFSEDKPIWSAQEVARRLGLGRSTTYRYLVSLRRVGLVVEDGNNRFRLGHGVFAMARACRAATSVVHLAAPIIWRLGHNFGATVGLQERVGAELIQLDILGPAGHVRRPRQLLPWPATCAAQVLLAFAPEAEREALFRRTVPTQYTERTPRDREALAKVLADIRRKGYAVSNGERDEGVWCVGAPVFSRGDAKYCLALAVEKAKAAAAQTAAMISAVELEASRLSADLAETER